MGNAPICQACHSDKGLRTHGNIQDLDKNSDYYGCNSEESKEPQALVSLGWRKRELKGKIRSGLCMLDLKRIYLLSLNLT